MNKYKFFIDVQKEEAWLNDMAHQGWTLKKVSSSVYTFPFVYAFERNPLTELKFKIDYRTFKTKDDFDDYRRLFQDSGWRHVAGTQRSGKQYFIQTAKAVDDDIFSDNVSKAARYKRLSDMWISIAISYIPLLVVFHLTGIVDTAALLNPKLLYYTPDLWNMAGATFWRAFLFETPFALMRGFLWLLIPILFLLYLFFAWRSNIQYQNTKDIV